MIVSLFMGTVAWCLGIRNETKQKTAIIYCVCSPCIRMYTRLHVVGKKKKKKKKKK